MKKVTKDGVTYRDYVLHGIEQGTNEYIHVKGTYNMDDKEIAEDVATQFKTFKELKDFLVTNKI